MKLITFTSDDIGDSPMLADYGTDPLLAAIIRDKPKIDALDARFLRIGRTLLVPANKAILKRWGGGKEDLVDSFVRAYREWRAAQQNLPFSDSEFNIWNGRAEGWEMLLKQKGVTVSGNLDIDDVNPVRPPLQGRILVGGLLAAGTIFALHQAHHTR